ncbi:MAG: hypothetical protein LQ351_004495 [Letrouitia transgressa]|nr:MAG: hypothetical protein LQ351_004495 [Letrouitia transgressa]
MLLGSRRSLIDLLRYSPSFISRAYSSLHYHQAFNGSNLPFANRSFHIQGPRKAPKRQKFFSSNVPPPNPQKDHDGQETPKSQKKKTRSPPGKTSLRRVAVEAQRSRDIKEQRRQTASDGSEVPKIVTAYCAAEQYDIAHVARILKGSGHRLDPYETGLFPQVVHVELLNSLPRKLDGGSQSTADIFIFPSGTVVAWAVPEDVMSTLLSETLLPASQNPHNSRMEEEDLEYVEDPKKESSSIKGDRIVLGTKSQAPNVESLSAGGSLEPHQSLSHTIDTVLAKIAFSSGLARSTKLAVLESLLAGYFESTRSIPAMLSHGGRLPTRSFILHKTGDLLNIRAQLNLYSELTDSLPDLFWDSRHELGLEGYYDQVGKALDTNIRIKVLNEKMDYAQEIASILRQQLSERHGVRLEWIIIGLIAVEVGFAVRQEFKEYKGG